MLQKPEQYVYLICPRTRCYTEILFQYVYGKCEDEEELDNEEIRET